MAQNPGGHDSFYPSTSNLGTFMYQSHDGGQERQHYDNDSKYDPYPPPPPPSNLPEQPIMANGYPLPPPPSSPPPSGHQYTQPIEDAVNHAFDNSPAAHSLPDQVIAQITAQVRNEVIDSLRKEFSSGQAQQSQYQPQSQPHQQHYSPVNGSDHQPTPPAPPAPPFSPVHQAGIASVPPMQAMPQRTPQFYGSSPTDSTKPAHTPPSPDKEFDESAYFTGNAARDTASYPLRASRDEGLSKPIPVSEKRKSNTSTASASSPVRSSTMREDLSFRYGDRTGDGPGSSSDRPTTTRVRTNDEETIVEKMWQPLFDADYQPTARMSQFLRGIALHLIEEYEPKHSLVIGPRKMKKFFDEMKLAEELFPWKDIFYLPTPQLSALYSSLSCQHHLIPRSTAPFEAPTLAALTPQGFANFIIALIQAHPSHEYHRLAITVRNWPVSNADERKERWPKELSRRLLPKSGSEAGRRKFYDALRKVNIPVPMASVPPPPSQPPPSSQQYSHPPPPASAPPQGHSSGYPPPPPSAGPSHNHSSSFSRPHRMSYVAPVQPNQPLHDEPEDISDDSSGPTFPLERERKPYVAKEGMGKIHGDDLNRTRPTSAAPTAQPIPQPNRRESMSSATGSNLPHHYSSAAGSNFMPPRTRERTGSNATESFSQRASYPTKLKPQRAQSPPYGRGSGDVDGAGSAYWPKHEEEDERLDRVTSHDEERRHERRYSRYDEDFADNRRNSYAGLSGGYAGNPPLGTGERRY